MRNVGDKARLPESKESSAAKDKKCIICRFASLSYEDDERGHLQHFIPAVVKHDAVGAADGSTYASQK